MEKFIITLKLKMNLKKNGYKFSTNSDTEVLIKALDKWGINCVKKLEGMWAFFTMIKLEKHLIFVEIDLEKSLYFI